jgi:hypothetical protein
METGFMSKLTTNAQEKSESRELSSEELDAVSGGWGPSVEKSVENRGQMDALKTFAQVLRDAQGL